MTISLPPPDVQRPKPYHHGDLSRALVQAGRRLLEREGASALSLRGVAREAGVSPAAPYHHFKDKTELLDAIAHEGWLALGAAIGAARAEARSPLEALTNIGVAYVMFAREHPDLYRVMYDAACERASMPKHATDDEDGGFRQVREAMIAAGADPGDDADLEVTAIGAWCAAHGVSEMIGFKEFEPLRERYGGESGLARVLLQHIGAFRGHVRTQ